MLTLKTVVCGLAVASLSFGAITGKVVDETGKAISGAQVQLFAQGSKVTTDAAGTFTLTYVAPVPTKIIFPPVPVAAPYTKLAKGRQYFLSAEGSDLVWSYDAVDDRPNDNVFLVGKGNRVLFTIPPKGGNITFSCAGRGGNQLIKYSMGSSTDAACLPTNVDISFQPSSEMSVTPKLLSASIKNNSLYLHLQKPSPVSLIMFDLSGKNVYSMKQQVNEGNAVIALPAERVNTFNVVRVETNEGFITLRSAMGKGFAITEYSSARRTVSSESAALSKTSAAMGVGDLIAVSTTGYAPCKVPVANSDSAGIVITMKKTNAAPLFTANYPKSRIDIDDGNTLNVVARYTDADNTALTFSIGPGTTLPRASTIVIANGATAAEKKVTWKSLSQEAGMFNLQLAVSDGYEVTTIDVNIVVDNSRCCPYVYLWDQGKSNYCYYTDLSGSPLSKSIDFFRPEYYGENIYELGQYQAQNGVYRMKLREVIYESCYFDQVKLLCVDVPKGYDVYNEWSFTSQLEVHPSRKFQTVRNLRAPLTAVDAAGRDVLSEVSAPDGKPLAADESTMSRVELDFGPLTNPENAKLVVTGWGYYSDFSKYQAPPYSSGMTIETKDAQGNWVVRKVSGKCSGDSRSWVVDLGNILKKDDSRFRLTMAHNPSVLDILDAVRIDDTPPVAIEVTTIPFAKADLKSGGSATVNSSSFLMRNDVRNDSLPLNTAALLSGNYTKYGDVRPLLKSSDDRFVIMAHGDEIVAEFKEPPKKAGYDRKVFMLADVYYTLQTHPLNLMQVTKSIEPLPYRGMKTYPYDISLWPYRNDKSYQKYLKTWNTRTIVAPGDLVRVE